MAEKDITEKVLMSHTDVFADCVNALVYGGRRRLRAEGKHPGPPVNFYGKKERMHNQFSDKSFFRMRGGETRVQYKSTIYRGK
nr:hypothetical protein [uncultured Acetatifactor sp.]